MRKRSCRRIHGLQYSWKGHKDRNRHKNRIKRSGQAWLSYLFDINHNIPTTRRWARGDWEAEGSISHVTKQPFLCSSLVESESIAMLPEPRSGELRTQKVKSHLVRTQSLNVLPLKPGVGQYIAIHATLTVRDFFLAYFYPSGPFTCIFSPKLLPIFPVLALANTWFLCRPVE